MLNITINDKKGIINCYLEKVVSRKNNINVTWNNLNAFTNKLTEKEINDYSMILNNNDYSKLDRLQELLERFYNFMR